ncbi:MAG TPA: prepilin-type N-terminal cleavage/methylation domain-containing protein [Patescibacteria group bacterium]|nr:prepilin-type N-terminal cleavage/methylation domain-containing protein [Patescibacteria group bacterium]
MRKYLSKGFTLVELLIVIALLGVIATIVIAAINPIEQANRAADAGKKADASQIVSAIERYYATHNQFPWQAPSCAANGGTFCDPITGAEAAMDFISADNPSIGICGANGTTCKTTANKGELIQALELQSQFISKSWVGATSTDAKLLVGKGPTSSSGVYVCWVPKSNSNRQNLITSATTNSNKMVDTTVAIQVSGVPAPGTCATTSDTGWGTGKCSECVPE